jgi:membrane protein required for colicin V production
MIKGLDLIITILASYLLIKGIWKGFVKEISGILAVVSGVIASFMCHSFAQSLLSSYVGEKYVSVVAYAGVFILAYAAIMFLGNVIDKILKSIMLGGFNRILGGLFGLIKALLWCAILTYGYTTAQAGLGFEHPQLVLDSVVYPFLIDFVVVLERLLA